ncbi:MAG: hypothetical protein WBC68_02345 [Albidovulum sp.]
MDRNALDQALLTAHTAGDLAALVHLYTQAADDQEAAGNINAACFYLTHAYVFALQSGSTAINDLNRRLCEHGREVRFEG